MMVSRIRDERNLNFRVIDAHTNDQGHLCHPISQNLIDYWRFDLIQFYLYYWHCRIKRSFMSICPEWDCGRRLQNAITWRNYPVSRWSCSFRFFGMCFRSGGLSYKAMWCHSCLTHCRWAAWQRTFRRFSRSFLSIIDTAGRWSRRRSNGWGRPEAFHQNWSRLFCCRRLCLISWCFGKMIRRGGRRLTGSGWFHCSAANATVMASYYEIKLNFVAVMTFLLARTLEASGKHLNCYVDSCLLCAAISNLNRLPKQIGLLNALNSNSVAELDYSAPRTFVHSSH